MKMLAVASGHVRHEHMNASIAAVGTGRRWARVSSCGVVDGRGPVSRCEKHARTGARGGFGGDGSHTIFGRWVTRPKLQAMMGCICGCVLLLVVLVLVLVVMTLPVAGEAAEHGGGGVLDLVRV